MSSERDKASGISIGQCPRLNWPTPLLLVVLIMSLVYANLAGEYMHDDVHFSAWGHGWPCMFLQREIVMNNGVPAMRWPFDEAIVFEFSWTMLALDTIVAIAVSWGTVSAAERFWTKHPPQFSLACLLAVVAWFASTIAWISRDYSIYGFFDDANIVFDHFVYGTVFFALPLTWYAIISLCGRLIVGRKQLP